MSLRRRTISLNGNLVEQYSADGSKTWHATPEEALRPTPLHSPTEVLRRIADLVTLLPGHRKGVDLHMLESVEAFAMLVQLGGERGTRVHRTGAIEHVRLRVGGLRVLANYRRGRSRTTSARLVAAGAMSMEDGR
jgi:hypothetical protein